MQVVVIGAGTMGAGIAQVSAQAGFHTTLHDANAAARDAAVTRIYDDWQAGIQRGKVTPAEFGAWKDRLHYCSDLDDATAEADLVMEAVVEDAAVKRQVLARAADWAPEHAVLATNTSALAIGDLAAATPCPDRVLGMHFFNPVPRMALVELVVHERLNDVTLNRARQAATAMGKTTITVQDSPGFATSRLGLVLGNEAMRMVAAGVASVADVDTGMRLGYGQPMGPLMLADLVGLDVHAAVAADLHRRLGGDQYAPPPILERLVEAGNLGQKSGRGFYDWSDREARARNASALMPALAPGT